LCFIWLVCAPDWLSGAFFALQLRKDAQQMLAFALKNAQIMEIKINPQKILC
jgi:hypothetical protein